MPLDFCINHPSRRQPKPDSQRGWMVWCCWIREEKQSLKHKHTSVATLRMSSPVMTFPTVDFKSFLVHGDDYWSQMMPLTTGRVIIMRNLKSAHFKVNCLNFPHLKPETFKPQGTHRAGLRFGVSGAWRLLWKLRAGWGSAAADLLLWWPQWRDWNRVTPPTAIRM